MLHRSLSDLDRLEHTRHRHSTEHKLEHWKKLEQQVDHLIHDIEVTYKHSTIHFQNVYRAFYPWLVLNKIQNLNIFISHFIHS